MLFLDFLERTYFPAARNFKMVVYSKKAKAADRIVEIFLKLVLQGMA